MDFFLSIVIQVLMFILFCQGWNLLYGYTNILHLGYVGFIAVGAYVAGLLTLAGIHVWLSILAALGFSAILGLLLALPTVRFKGDYLGIVTFGFGEIIRSVLLNWTSVTRGPLGLPGIPPLHIFGFPLHTNLRFFLFLVPLFLIISILLYRITHSPFGKILETIREDDTASHTLGKNIHGYRIQILVFVSALAGFLGAINLYYVRFTEPNVYRLEFLSLILLAVFAGGPGKYWGVMIAAAITYFLRDAFLLLDIAPSIIGPLRWIIIGSLLVGILIYKPHGFAGKRMAKKNY